MLSTSRITEANLNSSLESALEQVNTRLDEKKAGYHVGAVEGKELKSNQPVHLELVQSNKRTPIGITHFAKLTPDFDNVPFHETARTIDELAISILTAVEIHENALRNPDILITAAGTPFYKNGINVEIREGILFIEGKQITYQGQPFEASRLKGEEGIKFTRADNGDFETVNPIDQRRGKGIFFNQNSGEIYRK